MQTFIFGVIGASVIIGLYVLGWIINNPWMVGF